MTKKAAKVAIDGAELISEVMRLELNPGDLLVLRANTPIRPNYQVYLEKQLRRHFPDNQAIVLGGEFELFVVAEAEVAEDAGEGGGDDTE